MHPSLDPEEPSVQGEPKIRFAWLIPSYSCNKRCDFCYNGEDYLADKSRAPAEVVPRMVGALRQFRIEHITILGGEPLIYPHLELLVDQARSTGASISLVTNGIAFTTLPRKVAWLADGRVNQVLVSLEATVGDTKVAARTAQTDRRRRTLQVLTETRQAHGVPNWADTVTALADHQDLPVRFVIKLFAHTVRGIPRMVEEIAKTPHRRVLFSFGTSVIPEPDSGLPLLNPTELAEWYVRLELYCRTLGIAPSFYMNLPLCLFPPSFLERVIPEERATFGCSLLRGDSLILDHQGKIAQCTHFMPLSSENVFTDPGGRAAADVLADSWKSGEAARTREALAVARHEACLDCPCFQRNCWGGCPILWSRFDPADHIGKVAR